MKKINIDDNFKQEIIAKFTDYINKTKLADNKINFTMNIDNTVDSTKIQKPTVYISSLAYLKMMLYIRDTDIEIAWHGTVERNQKENWYFIKDVFLYPQIIRATTVDTDQEKYQDWLQNIEDDEVFNNIRFQGHSHVHMSTSPSSTDLNMYNNFLQVLPKNDFYIFMIMNKHGEITCFIYDLAKNLIYDTADINIKIIANKTQDLLKDITTEKEKYCEEHKYNFNNVYSNKALPTNYKSYKDYDDFYYYANRDIPDYSKTSDVNDLLDEIDNKYKNPHITLKKNITKIKGAKK